MQPLLRAGALARGHQRTLSLRLRALEAEGIVERRTYPEVPPRVEYTLTAKGEALVPLIEQMRSYGRDWLINGNGHQADTIRHAQPVAAGHTQAH